MNDCGENRVFHAVVSLKSKFDAKIGITIVFAVVALLALTLRGRNIHANEHRGSWSHTHE
jgi:hypothetical protein